MSFSSFAIEFSLSAGSFSKVAVRSKSQPGALQHLPEGFKPLPEGFQVLP
jgi:hypothetical protein